MENLYADRIEALREMMRGRGWDAVIFSGSDPHGSEYPAERWKQVEWLTGFTGEAGDVVVTLDHAGLWTDTRYFIQANRQLAGTGVELHKTRVPEQVLIPAWLRAHFDADAVIAVDGLCQSAGAIAELAEAFTVLSVPNLLDAFWEDRPGVPQTPVFTVETGESRSEKLAWLRAYLEERDCDEILLTALDEIAWILNVRASDIEYNPYVISYLLVSRDDARWFVLKEAVEDPETEAAFRAVEEDGVTLCRYDEIALALDDRDGRLLIDEGTLNYHLFSLLDRPVLSGTSPVGLRKAVKNPVEIARMRSVHVRDGVAMERFLYWLERSLSSDRRVTEWDAALQLGRYRAEIAGYQGDSFETISAWGEGAALPHYITPHTDAPVLEPRGLYLVDSGGQFLDGTTDITRTVPLGPCTDLEREDYTLVLKGHIGLATAVFPEGTAGCQIDALARIPLWRALRNFGHGTGHGVGFFLGVHEGPQDIRQNFNRQPLLPGMITSNEPGIYREGLHGVRHENLVLCVDGGQNTFGHWLRFETLTLCHFDTSAVIPELLTDDERAWLNAYNARVRDELSPLLPPDVAVWLAEKTLPL
ncbi:MAG: aminopeptidase P family protein [Bacteroidales bacterium]|nr:aminopeptidase P family protein [Bacteroidales bacterium]